MTNPEQALIDQFVGAAHGDFPTVRKLLEENPALLECPSSQAETALQAASHTGQVAIVEHLLSAGASLDICAAAMLGRAEDVSGFLAEDPGQRDSRGAHGIPLAFYPALMGHLEVLEILARAETDLSAGEGVATALHAATMTRRADVVKWLLGRDVDRGAKNFAGQTPLELAQEQGASDIAALLQGDESEP